MEKKKDDKLKYYSLKNILSKCAHYNMIIGERSNGKTYAVLKHGLEKYVKDEGQMAIIRRWGEDFKGKRAITLFNNLVNNGEIIKITNGEWSSIFYQSMQWFLCRYDDNGVMEKDIEPFAWGFSIASMEHDKMTSYPKITTILFDEFLTRTMYLPNEFIDFMNVLSTIIRLRNNIVIFLCGNTVNQYSPYFSEMGITNIKKMKQGDIDIYEYGTSGLKVAVEFSDSPNKNNKPSDVYFAFNNPKLSMITGNGTIWEIALYPHCPVKYRPKDIRFTYFIKFDNELLQCEIISFDNNLFTFIHRKTTEIKESNKDIIFTTEHSPLRNYRRKITNYTNDKEKKIASFFIKDKVFYQDNEVGEIVRNYLFWCKGSNSN